jgi:hypothetical protein
MGEHLGGYAAEPNAYWLSLDGKLTICVNLVALPALGRSGFL